MHSLYVLMAFLMLTIPPISSHANHPEYIHRVTFIGSLDKVTDKDLRDASISIEEGKVYSPTGLDRAIAEINKLGAFRKITRGDCKVTRSKSYPGTVDIEIRLKLRAPARTRSDKPK